MRNPEKTHAEIKNSLAHCLIKDNLLNTEAIPALIAAAQKSKIPLITHLVRSRILSSEQILSCCAKYSGLPIADLTGHVRNDYLPVDLMQRYRVIALSREENILCAGISDPTDQTIISALEFHTGLTISTKLVSESQLDHILSLAITPIPKISPVEEPATLYNIDDDDDNPVSEFVTRLLENAIAQQASDIHIEPYPAHCRIRFRRDGLLSEITNIPPHFAARLTTRLKILAQLDIAERRLPQDGRLQFSSIDIRINTCPTLSGEKIVLRLLDASKLKMDIHSLGFEKSQKELFLSKLTEPQGLILVTGPTGSGKTITLYSALNFLNHIEKNISSVEDPVEIELEGINQIGVNPRIGLDFATALRTLLRQDPDVIMLGEIRDSATAAIAVQAALTGHLVLSTLHTNHAIESILRLQSLGVAAHHFISAVSLIIAQRLIRTLCKYCDARGCDNCCQGYRGRIGVFECIPITEKLSSLILSGAKPSRILETINKERWLSLWDAGMLHAQNGITNHDELIRILGKRQMQCGY